MGGLRSGRLRFVGAQRHFLSCVALLVLMTPLAAQNAPDAMFAAAQSAFEALPEAERKAIQSDLIWTGDYSGVVDGSFGRRSFEALVAFETRNRTRPDGVLDAVERAALAQMAGRQAASLRFQSLRDEGSGIRIGVLLALLPRREARPGGLRFSSADGKASLTLLTGSPEVRDLAALYQQALQAGPGAFGAGSGGAGKITYRVLRPDWFVVAGEAGPSRYYLRQAMTGEGMRGYVLRYESSRAAEFDRIAIAVANSFELVGSADPAPSAASAAGQAQPSRTSPPGPAVTARAGTALRIGAGRYVLPVRLTQECKTFSVSGRPASVVKVTGGLAIVSGQAGPDAPQLRIASTAADGAVTVLAHADLGAGPILVAIPARVAGDRVTGVFQTGTTGAVVIDSMGGLAGYVSEEPIPARRVGGLLPAAALRVMPASDVAAALAGEGASIAGSGNAPLTSGLVSQMWRGALAPVTCTL